MKVLIESPANRFIPAVRDSWAALDTSGHEVTTLIIKGGDDPAAHRFENITRKYERARVAMLAGDYDAMLCLDDDQIIPPDALQRLIALDSDVAYGLSVWRHFPYRWTAATALGINTITTADQAKLTAQWWGQRVDVAGVGMFCTLIRRHVLEAIRFERRGQHCGDWYLALDCKAQGFTQRADCGVICGHVFEGGVLWPTPWGYSLEESPNGDY